MNPESGQLNIVLAQVNLHVGNIEANTQVIISAIKQAKSQQADVIVFPELTITGYPPEDLLFRDGLYSQINQSLKKITAETDDIYVILGYPRQENGKVLNAASCLHAGEILASYDKWALPNYSVFDEKRYFSEGDRACVISIKGVAVGITICEDVWAPEPVKAAVDEGAKLIVNINASPFHLGKMSARENIVSQRAKENSVPIVYVNLLGGQDELVFDGASFVVDAEGQIITRLAAFQPEQTIVSFNLPALTPQESIVNPHPDVFDAVFNALVTGVRDYVQKNGFKGVVIGLSGGIDSALTLVVAVKALGAENVEAVMLPTRYTSSMSLQDAEILATHLGVDYKTIAIESVFESFLSLLSDEFEGKPVDATEENIQARIRGLILMAISNKNGKMVLTTGNKSEMAVGYSTLYGDMAGGFDVLKDVPKSLVFEVSRYCNRDEEVIPVRIIERPPSAELREDQTDQDSLPDYDTLDAILDLYIEQEKSIDAIVELGFDEQIVKRVAWLVDLNEYKRRQAPPGVRITPKAFGRDRRYPITSGFCDKSPTK